MVVNARFVAFVLLVHSGEATNRLIEVAQNGELELHKAELVAV